MCITITRQLSEVRWKEKVINKMLGFWFLMSIQLEMLSNEKYWSQSLFIIHQIFTLCYFLNFLLLSVLFDEPWMIIPLPASWKWCVASLVSFVSILRSSYSTWSCVCCRPSSGFRDLWELHFSVGPSSSPLCFFVLLKLKHTSQADDCFRCFQCFCFHSHLKMHAFGSKLLNLCSLLPIKLVIEQ